jgi:NADPH2:quinone reductase
VAGEVVTGAGCWRAGDRVCALLAGGGYADKAAAARRPGADLAIDSSGEDFGTAAAAAGGVDVALDMIGAPYLAPTLHALNPDGRIVSIADQGGGVLELPLATLMRKRAVITGSLLRPRSADEKAALAQAVERVVWPWIEDGRLRVIVDRCFPLQKAAPAPACLESGRHRGKSV